MSARPLRRSSATRSRAARHGSARLDIALAVVAVLGVGGVLGGCVYGGYVPKEGPAKPLAESEANIADLPLGATATGELDCPAGRCRVRYRVVAPGPGELLVTVDGPGGAGENGSSGPRVAHAVLEGVGQQTLASRRRVDGPPPYELRSRVSPGVHYVLVQALGGPVEYRVKATFAPATPGGIDVTSEPGSELAATATATAAATAADAPSSTVKGAGVQREVVPMPQRARGDVSDGADYVGDPARDVGSLRRYAFAQDPAAMLRGENAKSQGDPFLLRQIQREIRYALADQGKRQVAASEAEFLVAVGVGTQTTNWYTYNTPGFSTQPYTHYFGLWDRGGIGLDTHTYKDGTLMIDFVDPKDGALMWHGWTTEPIPVSTSDRDALLRDAVRSVLGQL